MIDLTDGNFKKEVLDSDLPALVDFFADWCGPCKIATPMIEELAEKYQGKIKVGKLNVDKNKETAVKYGIMGIPAVVIFKKGKEVKRLVGFPGKAGYEKLLEEILT
jgi:thioredoxin 1